MSLEQGSFVYIIVRCLVSEYQKCNRLISLIQQLGFPLVIVPVQEEKAERKDEDDEEDIDSVAGLVLDSLSHSLIAPLNILRTGHCVCMNSVNILGLLQHFLSKDRLQLSNLHNLGLDLEKKQNII